jgi:hypothetical protein
MMQRIGENWNREMKISRGWLLLYGAMSDGLKTTGGKDTP